MSDTPETDNFIASAGYVRTDHQWRTFARKMERERDEAMSDLEFRRGLYKVLEEANNRLVAKNEEVVKLARTLKQERDEAREEIVGWENKWKCAIEMAAQAGVGRDNAQDQLDVAMKAIKRLEDQINELKS